MARRVEDSVVVITGASSGIGRATARAFAARGSALILAARRPLLLSEVAAECHHLGGKALAVPLDVADEHGMEALAHKATESFGHLDVWINNAGVAVAGKFEDIPWEAFHRSIETNLTGFIYGARACIRHFRKAGSGILINNACLMADAGLDAMAPYMVAKWGVRGLGVALRHELAGTGVHICTIASGPVDTPLLEHAANFAGRRIDVKGRLLLPEDVAAAIVACAEHPRPEVVLRGKATPGFSHRPAEATPGALFEPMSEGPKPDASHSARAVSA